MSSLSTVDLAKILCRSLFIQASWNEERMLGLGYCSCLIPFIKKQKKNLNDRIQFLRKNVGFFNTHPYMATAIIGATMKLHEQEAEPEKIDRFKKQLSNALGAVGDQLFWVYARAISATLGLILALSFGGIGLVAFLFFYNLPHLFVRIMGLRLGYKFGFDIVKYFSIHRFRPFLDFAARVAAVLAGGAIVVAGHSKIVGGFIELTALLGGAIGMLCLLKWRVSIPVALSVLLGLAAVSGFIVI